MRRTFSNLRGGGDTDATVTIITDDELKNAPLRARSARSSARLSSLGGTWAWDDLPEYLKENPYLLGHYRREAVTLRAALWTIFHMHNETVNIWTHLLGGLLFISAAVAFALWPALHPDGQGRQLLHSSQECSVFPFTHHASSWTGLAGSGLYVAPRWPQMLLLIAFSQVLLVSTACHTLCCISRSWFKSIWRLDYAAIAVSLTATFVPFIWYAFDCHHLRGWRNLYLGVACTLGFSNFTINMLERFQAPSFRVLRTALFCAEGAWGIAPVAHAAGLYWGSECGVRIAVMLTAAQMGLNVVGAAVFATRFPERWWPGRFDLVGHSHQIFHVIIVLVFCIYSVAGHTLWQWRSAKGECPAAVQ